MVEDREARISRILDRLESERLSDRERQNLTDLLEQLQSAQVVQQT